MDESKKKILLGGLVVILAVVLFFGIRSYQSTQKHVAYRIPVKPGQIGGKKAEVDAMNAANAARGGAPANSGAPSGPSAGQ